MINVSNGANVTSAIASSSMESLLKYYECLKIKTKWWQRMAAALLIAPAMMFILVGGTRDKFWLAALVFAFVYAFLASAFCEWALYIRGGLRRQMEDMKKSAAGGGAGSGFSRNIRKEKT